jgi:hypothetical protein
MEQQLPCGQLPQTVPSNWAPQDPSVVMGPVGPAAAVVVVVVDLMGVVDVWLLHPDWHPSPQCAAVSPHQPYCEQQPPCGQFPHTLPPFCVPQVPSVVALFAAHPD